jgi:hypothetical protein
MIKISSVNDCPKDSPNEPYGLSEKRYPRLFFGQAFFATHHYANCEKKYLAYSLRSIKINHLVVVLQAFFLIARKVLR